jgi:hypothetical protein
MPAFTTPAASSGITSKDRTMTWLERILVWAMPVTMLHRRRAQWAAMDTGSPAPRIAAPASTRTVGCRSGRCHSDAG